MKRRIYYEDIIDYKKVKKILISGVLVFLWKSNPDRKVRAVFI